MAWATDVVAAIITTAIGLTIYVLEKDEKGPSKSRDKPVPFYSFSYVLLVDSPAQN